LTNTALEIGRVLSDSPEGSTGAKSDIIGYFADGMMLQPAMAIFIRRTAVQSQVTQCR